MAWLTRRSPWRCINQGRNGTKTTTHALDKYPTQLCQIALGSTYPSLVPQTVHDGAPVVVVAVWSDNVRPSGSVPSPMFFRRLFNSYSIAVRIRPTTSQDAVSTPARFQRIVVHATSQTNVAVDAVSITPAASVSASPAATPTTPTTKKQLFAFDQVHPPTATQHALFTHTALPLISRFLEGFNCTILAYGQTSSGKTFTMTGFDLDANPSDPHNGMGIIPRAVSTIFSQAKKMKEDRGASWNYTIKGSFLEIYNEDLIDLLSSDDAPAVRREVHIRESKDGSIIWEGLREVSVRNSGEVMK